MKRNRRQPVEDNSMSDLVLDLWGDADAGGSEDERAERGLSADDRREQEGPEPPAGPSAYEATPAVRLAWGAAYAVRAVAVTAAVFVASALALTMIINPEMTLVEVINMYIAKFGDFVASIG